MKGCAARHASFICCSLVVRDLETVGAGHLLERFDSALITERQIGDLADLALEVADLIDGDLEYTARRNPIRIAALVPTGIEPAEYVQPIILAGAPSQHPGFDLAEVGDHQLLAGRGDEHGAQQFVKQVSAAGREFARVRRVSRHRADRAGLPAR